MIYSKKTGRLEKLERLCGKDISYNLVVSEERKNWIGIAIKKSFNFCKFKYCRKSIMNYKQRLGKISYDCINFIYLGFETINDKQKITISDCRGL